MTYTEKSVPACTYFVDAMSSFGAVPVDFSTGNIDVLVSSANKCLQGVPGFGFAVIRKDTLSRCKGRRVIASPPDITIS